MSSVNNTNLFQVLHRGDSRIESAHISAILLVGLTRAGKSTTCNWLLNKGMIGVKEDVEDFNAYYVNIVEGSESAELGNTYTSVTLCPNVVELDRVNRISLIDMAGFKDKRDYIGVIGVSYFLKAVFEKVRRAKFLIVIGEDKLVETSGDGIIDTFSEFISMFNVQLMDAATKKAFYNSVSIVVTRSEQETRHQGYLRKILKKLRDPKLVLQKREEIINLLEYLIDKNRIEPFKVAQLDREPEKSTLVERFNRMGWEFFDLQKSEKELGEELVSLPYQKDYEMLGQDQRSMFDTNITKRVDSYIHFSLILNSFISCVQKSWNNCIAQYETTGKYSLDLTDYEELFNRVRDFLQENDVYRSQKQALLVKIDDYPQLTFVQTLRKVLEIYQIIDRISDQSDSFLMSMDSYTDLFAKLIDCLLPFASFAPALRLLLRLKFIVKRGFRQFSKLYQINKDIIHDVSQKMKDNCSLIILQHPPKQFIENIVLKIDGKLMRLMFTKADDLLDYEKFFKLHEQALMKDSKETVFFSQHNYNIQMLKAALLAPSGKKRQMLQSYIESFRNICDIVYETSRSYKPDQEKEAQLNALFIKKRSIIKSITDILKDLKEVPSARDHALALSIHLKNANAVCELYDLIIAETTQPAKKLEKIGDYAEYCLEWGRFQKATTLLQWKLELQIDSFQRYQATIKKLEFVVKNQVVVLKKYQTNLTGMSNAVRLQEDDEDLKGLLIKLESSINEQ